MDKRLLSRKNELCSAWKGGKWKWAKRKIIERDNHTCKICGLREVGLMEIHHIKSRKEFPQLFYSLDNLITLCPNDHKRETMKEQKNKTPWNKGKKYSINEKKCLNISGLAIGHGWNRGVKARLNSGRTHFKEGHTPWHKGKNIQTNTGRTHFKKGMIPWNKRKANDFVANIFYK